MFRHLGLVFSTDFPDMWICGMPGSAARAHCSSVPTTSEVLLPDDRPARLFVKLVEELVLVEVKKNFSVSRDRVCHPPFMLIVLWLYSYVTGVNSSRKLVEATRMSLPLVFISGGFSLDYSTMSTFCKRMATQAIQVLDHEIKLIPAVVKRYLNG